MCVCACVHVCVVCVVCACVCSHVLQESTLIRILQDTFWVALHVLNDFLIQHVLIRPRSKAAHLPQSHPQGPLREGWDWVGCKMGQGVQKGKGSCQQSEANNSAGTSITFYIVQPSPHTHTTITHNWAM